MSYKVEGYWQESVTEEYESLEEALTVARRYADTYRNTVFNVVGEGFQGTVYAVAEEVSA